MYLRCTQARVALRARVLSYNRSMKLKTLESSLFEAACKEVGKHASNSQIMTYIDAKSRGRHKFCIECGAPLPYSGFYVRRIKYAPVGLTLECKDCINKESLKLREKSKNKEQVRNNSDFVRWSLDDDTFICDNYYYATDKELAKRLGRSEGEVKVHRLNDLKLRRYVTLDKSLRQRRFILSQLRRLDRLTTKN